MYKNPSSGRSSSDPSDKSDRSDSSESFKIIPPHGGYETLRGFHTAEAIYDGTVFFCERFVDRRSRTHDQMVQAARSGAQNISEASMASGTSKKTEIKLTGVARASLDELLRDYIDYLRQRGLRLWDKNSPEALAIRHRYKSEKSDLSARSDPYHFRTAAPEVAANTLICLINQATYLLHRQLSRLERDFLEHGGFTERLYAARRQARSKQSDSSDQSDRSNQSDPPEKPAPNCPRCGRPMCLRTARRGPHAGRSFWGCSAFPDCEGLLAE